MTNNFKHYLQIKDSVHEPLLAFPNVSDSEADVFFKTETWDHMLDSDDSVSCSWCYLH